MRFLFIGPGYPGAKGTSRGSGIGTYLRELTLGLIDRGYECHVLVWAEGTSCETQSIDGIAIHFLQHQYWPLLERVMPDSRDVYNMRRKVSCLHAKYKYDWIEIESEEGIGIGVERALPQKTILRIHTTLAQMVVYKQVSRSWKLRWRLTREARSFRLARHILASSSLHAKELKNDFPFMKTVAVVPLGISSLPGSGVNSRSLIPKNNWEKCRPTFLIVGTADRRKGFDRLRGVLEAYVSRHSPCKFVIISRCSELIKKEFGLLQPLSDSAAMEWKSDLSQDEMDREYLDASAMLHLARYESFGLPLIEAAAFGLPVVSTKVGIAPELFAGDLKRFLIDGDDPAGCADALAQAVAQQNVLGATFRKQYEEHFTRDKMAECWLAMLLNGKQKKDV